MTADEFQKFSAPTRVDRSDVHPNDLRTLLAWDAIGVSDEADEIVELARKQISRGHGIDREKWKKKLGDVLWCVAACCTRLELSLSDVMRANVDQLAARFPDGRDAAGTTEEVKSQIGD